MLFNVKKYTLYFLFYNIDKKYYKKSFLRESNSWPFAYKANALTN